MIIIRQVAYLSGMYLCTGPDRHTVLLKRHTVTNLISAKVLAQVEWALPILSDKEKAKGEDEKCVARR